MAHLLPSGVREETDGSLTLCCGKKDCPNVRFTPDGGAVVSDGPDTVTFTPTQLHSFRLLIERQEHGA